MIFISVSWCSWLEFVNVVCWHKEMLFVFQWILYAYFHLSALMSGLSGKEAYYYNPFELEAYDNDEKEDYLSERKPYAWVRYWRKV